MFLHLFCCFLSFTEFSADFSFVHYSLSNSSFSHQFLSSQFKSLICFLFYLLSLFCFLTNFSALHLQYYSFVFHKLLFTILHMVSFLFCFVSFPSFCSSTLRIPYYLSTQYFFTSRLSSLFQGITDSFRLEKIFKVISLSHELSVS